MQFTREINRLMIGLLIAFISVSASAAYWAMVGADTVLTREDNPRSVEAQAAIRRGALVDRHYQPLAISTVNDDGQLTRQYLHEATYSALGYYSLRYGVGGAEAAYDAFLSGAELPDTLGRRFQQEVLHQPQAGADVRLTLDLDVQQAVAAAMEDYRGAAVVMSVPDGGILALLSQPTYNPNTLNEQWDTLIDAPGNLFFNRVLQGRYQPGGMLQTPLMATALLTRQPLDEVSPDADAPLTVDDITLSCVLSPPQSALTLPQAYAYGCPRPFAQLIETVDDEQIRNILEAFRLQNPPTLDGFTNDVPPDEATPDLTAETTPEPTTTLYEDLLGQGDLSVNPLGMAALAAALINEGNAPMPYERLSVQPPDGAWQSIAPTSQTMPMMTDAIARRLRELMMQNVAMGVAAPAAQDGLTIGGHAALAYSGEETQAWFIGFVQLEGTRGASVAIVLEDTDDPQLAASIGGMALAAAHESLTTPATATATPAD